MFRKILLKFTEEISLIYTPGYMLLDGNNGLIWPFDEFGGECYKLLYSYFRYFIQHELEHGVNSFDFLIQFSFIKRLHPLFSKLDCILTRR